MLCLFSADNNVAYPYNQTGAKPMDISSISNRPPITVSATAGSTASAATASNNATGPASTPQETVALGQTAAEDALTYTDPRKTAAKDKPDLQSMLDESNRKVDEFMQLLGGMVEKQGLEWSKLVSGEQKLTADAETIAKAKEAVSEDGEFGVRKTAERILTFAKMGIGDDPEKIATFRKAVEKGFDDAAKVLGGKLPQISENTRKAIMSEFDRWEKEGIPTGDAVSLKKADTAKPANGINTSA